MFLVRLAANFKPVGARIEWATNGSSLNPVFAAPAPVWTLDEIGADATIFLLDTAGRDTATPVLHTAPAFERGPGSYGVLLGNGTFAMNNNGLMAYRMNFSVFDTTPPTVSEPLSTLLVGVALGLLLATRRPAIVPVPASAYAARRRGYAILGGHWCVSAWQALHQAYSAS